MKYVEISELYTSEKELIIDVPIMITKVIVKALDKCEREERLVNWNDLKKYVMEFFLVADYRAEDCIKRARKLTTYKLAFGSSIPDAE